jgi:hypothetical protein
MLKTIKTFQSEINAKVNTYNALVEEYIATVAPKLMLKVEQVRERIQEAVNTFQIEEQIQVREQTQAAVKTFQNRANRVNKSDVYKAFAESVYELKQLAQSFADIVVFPKSYELKQLAQSFVAEANQIYEQACQLDEQAFARVKDLKESIEHDRKNMDFMVEVGQAALRNDFNKVSQLINSIDSREKVEILISLIHKEKDLENFFRRYLPCRQDDYVDDAIIMALITFGITASASIPIVIFSGLPMIIAGSVTGGLTILSTIIAYFAVKYRSIYRFMLKNLDVPEKQNDVPEEQDDLKLREANDPLSEGYPLSEISETSDRRYASE